MRAARFSSFGGPDVLEIVELPDPHPGPGQVRIRVRAAGISPTDAKLRSGAVDFGDGLPQTTGRDVAGVVDEVGDGVTDVVVGDRVFGASDEAGGAAELTLVTNRAKIPAALGFVDAAGLTVALETATRGLDQLGVADAMTVLVNGAAGGIGTAAVQLAAARGGRVIGTASAHNHGYLRLLGAEPVTYGPGLVERVRALAPDGVDAALDVAGIDALPDLIELTGDAGHVIALADMAGAQQHGVHFSTGRDGHAFHILDEIGALIESGRFWLPVERTYAFTDIAEAHRAIETGRVRGRLVLIL